MCLYISGQQQYRIVIIFTLTFLLQSHRQITCLLNSPTATTQIQSSTPTHRRKQLPPTAVTTTSTVLYLLMTEFTQAEVAKLIDERGLNGEQIATLQRAAKQYAGKVTKEELLGSFRSLGYMPRLLEEDLKARFAKKEEKPVRITYDLLPNGQVENFSVTPVTD